MSDENCGCGTIGADPSIVTRCEHWHFWRGDKRLASVGRIIKDIWPIKPSWDGVDMAVVENARERGKAVDELFSAWVIGELSEIPAGTRKDAETGFNAVRKWWESQARAPALTQVVMADDDVVGIVDVVTEDGWLWDLKCSAKIESTYELQLGGYLDLAEVPRPTIYAAGVIHCQFTKGGTVATVKPVIFEPMKILSEWRVLRQMYQLVTRKTGGVKP